MFRDLINNKKTQSFKTQIIFINYSKSGQRKHLNILHTDNLYPPFTDGITE